MGRWQNKTVIGLTGNIGSGKSVVRKMLEQLGAYGIDADSLSHRAMMPGAPGFDPILGKFGNWLLAPNGTIDRSRLGKIVFNDPDALSELELILHPLVKDAIDILIQRAPQQIVVIEAIKLIEAGLTDACDSVWVTEVTPEVQLKRLLTKRGMKVSEARMRINAQPPQSEKLKAANIIINNSSSFTDTYQQVVTAWKKTIPTPYQGTRFLPTLPKKAAGNDEFLVIRAKPAYANLIAEMVNRYNLSTEESTPEKIMAAFGEKAFLLLLARQKVMGLLGWKVENLVACTTEIGLDSTIPVSQALEALLIEMEKSSRELQCEASLVSIPQSFSGIDSVWEKLGYQSRTPESLSFAAWKDAALECCQNGNKVYFKQLRMDQVLRPI